MTAASKDYRIHGEIERTTFTVAPDALRESHVDGVCISIVADTNDCNSVLIGCSDDRGEVDNDDATDANRNAAASCAMHVFNGRYTDRRHIGAHVVAGARGFEKCPTSAPTKLPGTLDHAISAFDRFDRDHILLSHGDRLPNIERADLPQERPTKQDVTALFGSWFALGHRAFAGHVIGNVRGGVDQDEPFFREVIREDGEERRASAVMSQFAVPKIGRAPVGQLTEQLEWIVHPRFGNTADHDGVSHPKFARESQPTTELNNARALEQIAACGQLRLELIAQSNACHAASGRTNALCYENRQLALSRDQTDGRQIVEGVGISALHGSVNVEGRGVAYFRARCDARLVRCGGLTLRPHRKKSLRIRGDRRRSFGREPIDKWFEFGAEPQHFAERFASKSFAN